MMKSDLQPYEFDQFYGTYLSALEEVDLLEALRDGMNGFIKFMWNIPEKDLNSAYGENKWTIAEVLGHIIDTERVFQYRALRFSRNDKTALPGFEQDDYVLSSNSKERGRDSLIDEYIAVRKATIALFANLNKEQLGRTGTASNIQWSVAGLGFIISGHQEHHKKILEERYL